MLGLHRLDIRQMSVIHRLKLTREFCCSLKGQCHAILVKIKNTRLCTNAPKDGGDENGLKLEKNWPVFSGLETMSSESRQKLNTNSSLGHIIFRIISLTHQECYIMS